MCICGGKVTAGTTTDDQDVVLHSIPFCKDYEKRDPLEFVIWLRRALDSRN